MVAADRAMYQAKSLGKNQISGNPRPRRSTQRQLLAPPEEGSAPGAEAAVAAPPPLAEAASPEPQAVEPVVIAPSPPNSAPSTTAFAVEPASTNGAGREPHGDDEPDPADMRRQIAAARRNMDPDHQIRRAMDAFLSSPTSSRVIDREERS
jgi:hypothetical protein